MTHLIIPIADIQEHIKAIDDLGIYKDAYDAHEISAFRNLINRSKKISLTEEDIETKSFEIYPVLPDLDKQPLIEVEKQISKRIGYCKALKDII